MLLFRSGGLTKAEEAGESGGALTDEGSFHGAHTLPLKPEATLGLEFQLAGNGREKRI